MNSDRFSEDWMQTERKSDGGALLARKHKFKKFEPRKRILEPFSL